jgi:hypothetical protein
MIQFKPIVRSDELPLVGAKVESQTFDIKRTYETTKQFEAAKDVTAFANHLGGTLLIGAAEKDGGLSRYLPIEEKQANDIATLFEHAVKNRCRPLPLVDVKQIPHEGGFVVVVNVWPTLTAPIGVQIRGSKDDGFGDTAWVFPIRVATQTSFITPENLPMYMNAKDRKSALLLSQIAMNSTVIYRYRNPSGLAVFQGKFRGFEPESNAVHLQQDNVDRISTFPIDQILTLYQDNGLWRLIFDEILA